MNNNGPIIVIEDDEDDQKLLMEVFATLHYSNEVIYFADGIQAYNYLISSDRRPFLILSDMNLPKLNGLETRDKIHNDNQAGLRRVPYVFFTTSASRQAIIDAYAGSVQGFFVKPDNYAGLESILKKIVEYWKECKPPDFQRKIA